MNKWIGVYSDKVIDNMMDREVYVLEVVVNDDCCWWWWVDWLVASLWRLER